MSRNHSMDTLRTIACILVVAIHVVAPQINKENTSSQNFNLSFVIDTFSRVAVPLFVMISGRFLLLKDVDYKEFYNKRLTRIVLSLIFWIIVYIISTIGFNIAENEQIDYKYMVKSIFLGKPHYHLWYLYMLIGLYLITPVLNKAFKGLTPATLTKVGLALVFISMINQTYNFIYDAKQLFVVWSFNYVGYFILGYSMKDKKYLSNVWLVLIFIFSSLANNFISLKIFLKHDILPFYNYISPFVIVGALALYSLFSNLKLRNNILSRIANLSFGIYLIHPLIIKFSSLLIKKDYLFKELTIIILVFLISGLIIFLLEKNKRLAKVI